jgi:hypothetical protein
MVNTHRIKIKLGNAEFEAEGAEESVQSQYERFLQAVERTSPKQPAAQTPQNGTQEQVQPPTGLFDDALLSRIFDVRQDGVVALKVLPKGQDKEADSLLLILFGYWRLKNEERIGATQLIRAAQYSGIPVNSPAQALAIHDRYFIRGGQRKGTTYCLNNQGITLAEGIASKIFD